MITTSNTGSTPVTDNETRDSAWASIPASAVSRPMRRYMRPVEGEQGVLEMDAADIVAYSFYPAVEMGMRVRILSHGTPMAEIRPYSAEDPVYHREGRSDWDENQVYPIAQLRQIFPSALRKHGKVLITYYNRPAMVAEILPEHNQMLEAIDEFVRRHIAHRPNSAVPTRVLYRAFRALYPDVQVARRFLSHRIGELLDGELVISSFRGYGPRWFGNPSQMLLLDYELKPHPKISSRILHGHSLSTRYKLMRHAGLGHVEAVGAIHAHLAARFGAKRYTRKRRHSVDDALNYLAACADYCVQGTNIGCQDDEQDEQGDQGLGA